MIELLSPGGTLEMVREALNEGADSVYVGPVGWSRREARYELQHHEVREAVRMAHEKGAKLRVALNADIEPGDHPDMMRKVEAYAQWGVDGFIMKTPEAMATVHDRFPEITIHASVGTNVRNRRRMEEVAEAGASQFVASTALNTFDRIAGLKNTADEVGVGVELLIHSNRCVTGVGGCRLYDYFGPYFEEEIVHDSDGSHRVKLIGNPDKGGVCYRPCLGTHIPEIAERFPRPVLTYLEKSNNEVYQLLEDIPEYMSLGVTTLKIQGREYPTEVIAELTRLYRKLIDQVKQGRPDIAGARADLDKVLPDRDRTRNAKTQELHVRLLNRMGVESESGSGAKAGKVCHACGAREEELHRTSVSRTDTSEWDPDNEETALLVSEPEG
ncbi:MAG TPA: peptidase U32 family protein [Actinomycetota bacterium]|jgi:putative protease|nr:peptidase U32 family protein [Actinomycetota bacterium]